MCWYWFGGFFSAFFLFLPDFESRRQSFGFVRTAYEGAKSWARKQAWQMGIIHGCGQGEAGEISGRVGIPSKTGADPIADHSWALSAYSAD